MPPSPSFHLFSGPEIFTHIIFKGLLEYYQGGLEVIIQEMKNQESSISVPGKDHKLVVPQQSSFPWDYLCDNTDDNTFDILCKRCFIFVI